MLKVYKINRSNNEKYLAFHYLKVKSTRNCKLWQLSRRFQTLIWRPGEMAQNRESRGFSGRVNRALSFLLESTLTVKNSENLYDWQNLNC